MEMGAAKIHRQRRPASEWQSLIEDWRLSGLSQKAFCAKHGLAISTFCKWVNKLSAPGADNVFAELVSLPQSNDVNGESPWLVELDLGSGIVLRIAREG